MSVLAKDIVSLALRFQINCVVIMDHYHPLLVGSTNTSYLLILRSFSSTTVNHMEYNHVGCNFAAF